MTSLNDEVALLRTVPFFSSIDSGRLKLLAYASEKLAFEDGDVIFRKGEPENDTFFILDGAADVVDETSGEPIIIAHLPRYSLFGEISAFCNMPRTATMRASGHLVVLRIPQEHFIDLIRSSPAMALQIIRVLALRLVDTTSDLVAARAEGHTGHQHPSGDV